MDEFDWFGLDQYVPLDDPVDTLMSGTLFGCVAILIIVLIGRIHGIS